MDAHSEDAAKLRKLEELKAMRARLIDRRIERWKNDPIAWQKDVLPEVELTAYQELELRTLEKDRMIGVRAPRGAGKTMPAAVAVIRFATLWELMGVDWKIPVTAGTWGQLRTFTMPEVHKWLRKLNWDKMGLEPWRKNRELMTLRIKTDHGEAFAINSDDPELIEGAHADHMLLVVDEAKSVPDGSWDAMEGYFSGTGDFYRFVISTPSAPVGRFHDICMQRPGYEDWTAIHVTIEEAIAQRRISETWRAQRERQWGVESQAYKTHVLAEFGGEEDGVIPLSWIEAAMERHESHQGKPEVLGVDVGDVGEDKTIFAHRVANHVYRLEAFPEADTKLHANRIKQRIYKGTEVQLDTIGVGAGVRDNLKGYRVVPFVASKATKRKDSTGSFGFANVRSAAWWNLREMLHPDADDPVALVPDDMLLGDLSAPRWQETGNGKILVESKKDIKRRLGRSTDYADAVVQAMWAGSKRRRSSAGNVNAWGQVDDSGLTQSSWLDNLDLR